MKWLLRLGLVLGLAALAIAGVALGARFGDGPIFIFPGGPLESGDVVDYGSIDWAELAHVREVELQLETPARSRTTWLLVFDGTPYIPCGLCTNTFVKRWPRQLEADDRVVLRVDGRRVRARARRVPHASEEFFSVVRVSDAKYRGSSEPREAAEGVAAGAVVGAVDLAGQAIDPSSSEEPDYWLFRIEPR